MNPNEEIAYLKGRIIEVGRQAIGAMESGSCGSASLLMQEQRQLKERLEELETRERLKNVRLADLI